MMILFLAKKWLLPKQKGPLKDLTYIFLGMVTLCSFLAILSAMIIQFLQFAILTSFVQKDFHFSFLNTTNNVEIWSAEQKNLEQTLKSPIAKTFLYTRQSGLLIYQDIKLPIQIQFIHQDFFDHSFVPFKKGNWNESIPSISISEEMAYQLGLQLEDIVEFHFIRKNYFATEPTVLKLMVSSIIKDVPGNDPYLAFSPLVPVQDLFYTQLQTGVLLQNINDVNQWKTALYSKTGMHINDVFSRHYNLLFSFQWEKTLLYFVLMMILMISFIIIYISFSIVFKEYKKQWSLLKVLGLPITVLMGVFLIKTIVIVIVGFLVGLLLALTLFIIYAFSISLPIILVFQEIIQWHSFIILFFIELLMSLIAFIRPIYKLYNQSILEGLKDES